MLRLNNLELDPSEIVPPIFTCPSEILHKILCQIDPIDVVNFAQSSRVAYQFFRPNPSLSKALFLSLFDPPTTVEHDPEYDFEIHLRKRMQARCYVRSQRESDLLDYYIPTVTTLIEIATAPLPPHFETSSGANPSSKNRLFLDQLFPLPESTSSLSVIPHQRWFLRDESGIPLKFEVTTLQTQLQTQLAARLSALRTPVTIARTSSLGFARSALPLHRATVYDRRNVTKKSLWGPFLNDLTILSNRSTRNTIAGGMADQIGGKVDWVKVEAIAQVMKLNVGRAIEDWKEDDADMNMPRGWDSTRTTRRAQVTTDEGEKVEEKQRNLRDWAGVEEFVWIGSHAFLDYGTWEHFNFHRPNGVAPDLDGEEEIVGDCMALKLRITPDLEDEVAYVSQAVSNAMVVDEVDDDEEQAGRNDALDSDYDPTRRNEPLKVAKTLIHSLVPQSTPSLLSPSTSTSHSNSETSRKPVNKPLRFTGSFSNVSGTITAANRSVYGIVRMTEEGDVHWRYIIRYDGEDRWMMNGVQVGGVGSKFGIVGCWTAVEHDVTSPNGPFWYWPNDPKTKFVAPLE